MDLAITSATTHRRKTMPQLDFYSIPEEITCTQIRRQLSHSPTSSHEPTSSMGQGYLENTKQDTNISNQIDGVHITKECSMVPEDDELLHLQGDDKESPSSSSTVSDDQSDLSDSDSGFSGSNKEFMANIDQWYGFIKY